MSIKLIVSDMDGTLLNENLNMTQRTTEAILAAQATGIEFAVATGRAFSSGHPIIQAEGIQAPFISLNGAQLFNEKQELQFSRKINREDLSELLEIIEKHNVQSQLRTQDSAFSNNSVEDQIQSYKETFRRINPAIPEETLRENVVNHLERNGVQQVTDYDFILEDPNIQLMKILLGSHDNKKSLDQIEQVITKNLPNLIITSASEGTIEINHALANKGQAVADLAAMKGYTRDEVITIGDNLNDAPMLEWATHSYAVANAHILAKKAAQYSAPSNVDDAVAIIIENVLSSDKFIL